MGRTNGRGQEAIEFVLITTLVFFGALFVVLVFGSKISNFFTYGSSVAQTANNSVVVLDANSNQKFNPDYDTYVDYATTDPNAVKAVEGSTPGTVDIIIGDLKVSAVPDSTEAYIQTSGSSGYTENLTQSIESMVAYLQTLSEADPSNTELASMVNAAKKMANTGHLIADSEEWAEYAAKRLSSKEGIYIPDDNLLCENQTSYEEGCDRHIDSQDFFYNDDTMEEIPTAISEFIKDLNNSKNTLNSLSETQSDQVKQVVDIINVLATEIDDISLKVKGQLKSTDVVDLDSLNSNIASQKTDLKSELIKMAGTYFSSKQPLTETKAATTSENTATISDSTNKTTVNKATTVAPATTSEHQENSGVPAEGGDK